MHQQRACCISPTSPISGTSQHGVDIARVEIFFTSGMNVFGSSPRRQHLPALPRKAVVDVPNINAYTSKAQARGRNHTINNQISLLKLFVTTLIALFFDDPNKTGMCWLRLSTQLHATASSR